MTASVQQRLAELVASLRYDDLPAEVVRSTKLLLLDSLGCAFGGVDSRPAVAVRKMAERLGGRPQATVIGRGGKTSCALAVLANGTALRYLDFNDYYTGRDPAHPSSNLPVALALGESEGHSGRELIAAIVAGYEIHLRLCDYAGQPSLWKRGWHHSTNAQFSAAAIAARLLGGDAATIAHALAIAASHHNTLAQLQAGSVAMTKATAEAWVAKGAVEAALLASQGITGPAEIFEGKSGWTAAVAGEVSYEELTVPFEGSFRISETCIKPYAVVGPALPAVEAAIDIHRSHRIQPAEVKRVRVHLPAFVLATPSADPAKRLPENRETADHSYQYCVALALLEGDCSEAQFTEEKIKSPLVRELLLKTELAEDPKISAHWPRAMVAAVIVELANGDLLEKLVLPQPGHPQNPLSEAQIFVKFDRLVSLAGEKKTRIKTAVLDLENCDHIGDFMQLLEEKKTC